ncbi:MAG TPA: VWA domain-containing protein [Vicinamibacteria bacterium]
MTLRPLALAASFALAVAGGLPAQEKPKEPATPVFSSDVSLVLMPVFVIDKDGKAVRGLSAADFEVQQDGRPAEVVSFRYVDTTDAEDQDELRVASAARRRFLLLFDKSFTDLPGLDRSRRAAGDFVRRRLTPTDLAAVATFDVQNGVRVVANFTEDRALLSHAIATLGVPTVTRISDPLGLAADIGITDLQVVEGASDTSTEGAADSFARAQLARMRSADEQTYLHNVGTLLDGFDALAAGLRVVEGRKQVLYFSAGFDARVLVGQWGGDQRTQSEAVTRGQLWEVDNMARFGDSRLRETLSKTTRNLSAADTVVHSIDVTGLGSDRSLTQTAASETLGRDTTNRESLGFFANETGGRLFDNANDLKPALAEMLEMTSRYYVLGIQPEREKAPGAFHKLKVKVARKGVKLSHRPGYFERSAPGASQTKLQRQFDLAELVVTGEGRNDVPFTSLCLPFPSPDDKQTLGLVVQVPRESLPWAGSEPVQLEVYGYAVGDDGGVRDHLAQSLKLEPARADPAGQARGVSVFGTFEVPPGRYTIRIMVREATSGKSAVRILDVTVPPYDARSVFALPPLVLDEPERWLKLEIGRGQGGGADTAPPFRVDASPFVPRASFEVHPGGRERLVLMVFDPELSGDPAADIEIRSSLTASDGRAVEPGRLKIERVHDDGDGRRTFVFSYLPEEVAAGDYTLKIGLGESGSFAQSYALLRFRPAPAGAKVSGGS